MLQAAGADFKPDRVGFMVAAPAVKRLAFWVCALVVASMVAVPAMAQTGAIAPIEFDIPPQPLASALVHYGDVTGKEALYKSGLVDGRVTGGVEGRLTPKAALRQLLVGTGVAERFVTESIFILEPFPESRPVQNSAVRRYHTLVEEDVLKTLCRIGEAKPGQYRLVTVFWIASDGTVEDLLRVGTAGRAEIDQLIDRTLRGLRFREPPPVGFVQPVRLLFVPQSSHGRWGCTAAEGAP